jgi:hypothetical protein
MALFGFDLAFAVETATVLASAGSPDHQRRGLASHHRPVRDRCRRRAVHRACVCRGAGLGRARSARPGGGRRQRPVRRLHGHRRAHGGRHAGAGHRVRRPAGNRRGWQCCRGRAGGQVLGPRMRARPRRADVSRPLPGQGVRGGKPAGTRHGDDHRAQPCEPDRRAAHALHPAHRCGVRGRHPLGGEVVGQAAALGTATHHRRPVTPPGGPHPHP